MFVCHEAIDGKVSSRERRVWSSSGMEGESAGGGHDGDGSSERVILIM